GRRGGEGHSVSVTTLSKARALYWRRSLRVLYRNLYPLACNRWLWFGVKGKRQGLFVIAGDLGLGPLNRLGRLIQVGHNNFVGGGRGDAHPGVSHFVVV